MQKFNNFYEVIERNSQKYGKKVAYFVDKSKIRWREFKDLVDRFTTILTNYDIKKNDKVALYMTNSLEFLIAYFAIQRIGAVVVPINIFLKEEEISYILNDVGAKLIVASEKFKNNLNSIKIEKIFEDKLKKEELLKITPTTTPSPAKIEDLAVIIYTSGTTGLPKGAMLTYKNLFSNIIAINKIVKITPKDRFIAYLPMFHSFTMTVNILLPLYTASAVVIIKSIHPFSNIIKEILFKRVTIFTGIPDVYSALARAKIPLLFHLFNKIRFFISGAAPLSEETIKKFSKKFKKAPLLEGYGLSEASPVVAVNRLDKQKVGSVGLPLDGVEVKIVNEDLVEVPVGESGEIIVKGDNVMLGYFNNKEATENTIINGWLLTGDIGKIDEDGFLYILDRKKDLIISKGVNIYPREIEEVCMKFDGIKACAVVGLKEENDEIPIAFVEVEKDIDIKELKNFLKKHLANYKIPKKIYIVDNLPKNATGKVLKRVLKERLNEYLSNV